MDTARTHTEPNTTANPSGRDAQGRFQKGNPGGHGNPFARQTAQLRRAALDAVSADDIRDIIDTLKTKARDGDVAAAKLLLSYTVGKPTNAPDPDTLDQHEWATITNNHAPTPEALIQIMRGMPVEALLLMLREALPALFPDKLDMAAAAVVKAHKLDDDEWEDEDDDDEDEHDEDKDEQPDTTAAAPDVHEQHAPAAEPVPDWMHELLHRIGAQTEQVTPPKAPIPPLDNGCNGEFIRDIMSRDPAVPA